MESSTKLLKQLLKGFSPHERKDIFTMFAIIGCETYLQRHQEDVNLTGSMVKVEHAKSYSKLLKHRHQHHNNTKEGGKGTSDKEELTATTNKKSNDNDATSKKTRRHDGLKHYPFVDEFGSVVDVLKEVGGVTSNPSTSKCPAAMVDPILKHTIKKVFDEFKIGSNGLKASDIPEALKSIRTQELDYSFLPQHHHEARDGSLEVESLAAHKLISFPQWTQIVRRRVRQYLIDQSQNPLAAPRSSHMTFPEEDFDHCDDQEEDSLEGGNGADEEDEDEDDFIHDEEEWVMPSSTAADQPLPGRGRKARGGKKAGGAGRGAGATYRRDTVSSQQHKNRGRGGGGSKGGDHLFQLHPRPASQKHPSRGAQISVRDAAQARNEALQKVIQSSVGQQSFKLPSPTSHEDSEAAGSSSTTGRNRKVIGDTRAQILADKRHAQQVRAARQTAAMRAIASSKVSYLPDEDEDKGEDENGSGSGRGGVGKKGTGSESSQRRRAPVTPSAAAAAGRGEKGKAKKGKKPCDTALGSGSAALDIANAFLTGTLGQQLLSSEGRNQSAGGGGGGDENESSSSSAKQEERNINMSYKFDIAKGGLKDGAQEKEKETEEEEGREGQEEEKKVSELRYAQYSGKSKFQSCPPLYDDENTDSNLNQMGSRFASSRLRPDQRRQEAEGGKASGKGRGGRGKEEEDGAEYYAENWRSTQGGWVADFGAPHTHTLSGKDDDSDYDL